MAGKTVFLRTNMTIMNLSSDSIGIHFIRNYLDVVFRKSFNYFIFEFAFYIFALFLFVGIWAVALLQLIGLW